MRFRFGAALLATSLLVGPVRAQQPAGVAGSWVLVRPADPADIRRSPIRLVIERDDDGVAITRYIIYRDAAVHEGQAFLADSRTYYAYKRGFVMNDLRAEWQGQTLITGTVTSPVDTTYSINDRGLLVVEHQPTRAAELRTDYYVRDSR